MKLHRTDVKWFRDLKKHMLSIHYDEPAVIKMKAATVLNPNSREPMKKLLHAGDKKHNQDPKLNQGFMTTGRVTNKPHSGADLTTCRNCDITVLTLNFRKHFSKCTQTNYSKIRGLVALGGVSYNKWHPTASAEFIEKIGKYLNPNCPIIKLIRYDLLIVTYGNEMVQKYRRERTKAHIVTQLRRLGYLKKVLKVKQLREIFFAANVGKIMTAIEKLAQINEEKDELKHPTVATGYRTLLQFMVGCLLSIYIRTNNKEAQKTVKDFELEFKRQFNIQLTKLAAESLNDHKRHKEKLMPRIDDIKKLQKFLLTNRNDCYEKLKVEFTKEIPCFAEGQYDLVTDDKL